MPTYFTRDLRGGRKGRFVKEIFKDAQIKAAFDKPDEQNLLVEAVEKFSRPGEKMTNDTFRKASGYMQKKGIIDSRERRAFEKLVKAGPKHVAYREMAEKPRPIKNFPGAAVRPSLNQNFGRALGRRNPLGSSGIFRK